MVQRTCALVLESLSVRAGLDARSSKPAPTEKRQRPREAAAPVNAADVADAQARSSPKVRLPIAAAVAVLSVAAAAVGPIEVGDAVLTSALPLAQVVQDVKWRPFTAAASRA